MSGEAGLRRRHTFSVAFGLAGPLPLAVAWYSVEYVALAVRATLREVLLRKPKHSHVTRSEIVSFWFGD